MDLENIDIEKEYPELFAIKKENSFSVPNHYFDTLKENIKTQIYINKSCSTPGFTIPENYFNQLTEQINSAIRIDNLKEETNFKDGFTVADDYFETLKAGILSKTTAEKSTVKRPIKKIGIWFSYAAAASVMLFVAIGLYLNTQTTEYQLNRIPDQDIINYLQLHVDEGDTYTIIENLPDAELGIADDASTNDLQHYLKNTL